MVKGQVSVWLRSEAQWSGVVADRSAAFAWRVSGLGSPGGKLGI